MKGKRFYSVPYDARNDPVMMRVRLTCGGIVAFGRWQALLGILYDMDGIIDLSDEIMHKVIEAELELKGEKLDEFIDVLVAVGWIDLAMWEMQRKVVSNSVVEQLDYNAGGRPRKARQEGEGDEKTPAKTPRKTSRKTPAKTSDET